MNIKEKLVQFFGLTPQDFRNLPFLALIVITANFAAYFPYLSDLSTVGRYIDGPHYIEVAKSLYHNITANNAAHVPPSYFAVHLPGFPIFIRLFSFIGYLNAMLFVVALFTILSSWIFYLILKEFKITVNPFWLTLVFLFFPPRWLLYHSVGASEPVFIFFTFLSLYLFKKEKYFLSFLTGGYAAITRIFGVLLYGVYFFLAARAKKFWLWGLALIIPVSLALNFWVYQNIFGNFWAYFNQNSEQLSRIPFEALYLKLTASPSPILPLAEFYILVMAVTIVGICRLWPKKELFWYSAILFLPVPFVVQTDFTRFFLPIIPFVWLVSYKEFFESKVFKYMFILVLVFSYLYVWKAIPTNLFPPDAWLNLMGGQI